MSERFWSSGRGALHKVSLLLAGLLLAALLFAAYNYLLYNRITTQYLKSEQEYMGAMRIKEAVRICDATMRDYLATGNRARLVEHNANVRVIDNTLAQYRQQSSTPKITAMLQSIEDTFYSYQTNSNYSAFYQSQNDRISSTSSLRQALNISVYLQRYCDDLLLDLLAGNREYYLRQQNNQHLVLLLNLSLFFALAGCAVLALMYLHHAFQRPLYRLYRAAQSLGAGDFDVRVEENCSEEMLQTVSVAFNAMAGNVLNMMKDVSHKAKLEKQLLNEHLKNNEYMRLLEQAHFLALQSQTNPHFLFNTLSSISRTVTLGNPDAAVSMIDALAELLRYNLNDSATPASLQEEMNIVRKYIAIQQYRFGARVQATFAYDEHILQAVRLPRFTLQPIVENAIIHGLEPKPEGGRITLRVWIENGFCMVEVEDDGIGMTEDRLRQLTANLQAQGHTGSIGIYNTTKRLELFTHRKNTLTITSQPMRGTTACIALPLEEKYV